MFARKTVLRIPRLAQKNRRLNLSRRVLRIVLRSQKDGLFVEVPFAWSSSKVLDFWSNGPVYRVLSRIVTSCRRQNEQDKTCSDKDENFDILYINGNLNTPKKQSMMYFSRQTREESKYDYFMVQEKKLVVGFIRKSDGSGYTYDYLIGDD